MFYGLYQPPRKKWELKKRRSWDYFETFWHELCMGWTTRNNEKSGSYPSLKLAVEIQSSALWNSGIRLVHLLGLDSPNGHPGFKFYPQKILFLEWGIDFEIQFLGFLAKKWEKHEIF